MKLIAAFKDPETGNYVGALRPLEIAHTKGHYGLFKHFPMTVKHDLRSPTSPLRDTTVDHIMLLEVTVTATDSNGNPVFAAANYHPRTRTSSRRHVFRARTATACILGY